jgi:hypothetical protein
MGAAKVAVMHPQTPWDARTRRTESARAASALAEPSPFAECIAEAEAFAAELLALFTREPSADRAELAFRALHVVTLATVHETLEGAVLLARSRHADEAPVDHGDAVSKLGRCTWEFVRAGDAARLLPQR